jgi:hypothetical protein
LIFAIKLRYKQTIKRYYFLFGVIITILYVLAKHDDRFSVIETRFGSADESFERLLVATMWLLLTNF